GAGSAGMATGHPHADRSGGRPRADPVRTHGYAASHRARAGGDQPAFARTIAPDGRAPSCRSIHGASPMAAFGQARRTMIVGYCPADGYMIFSVALRPPNQ